MGRPRRISNLLPQVLAGLGVQYQSTRSGRIVIDTLTEDPEILLGLLDSAVEAGLIRSIGEISAVCVNGRLISMVGC